MALSAREMKDAIARRHPASGGQMPGAWTVIEEWMEIDVLAISAWSSQGGFARIGYEVKVSRSDLRRELLRPGKRQRQVEWCNSFYFAVPKGLLTDDELAYVEPEWDDKDFLREPCPRAIGRHDYAGRSDRDLWKQRCSRGVVREPFIGPLMPWRVDEPRYWNGVTRPDVDVPCPACGGKGYAAKSRVELEAPTLWVPRDVGLVVVDGRGSQLVRKAPARKEVPALNKRELGQLIRWVSMRPDPRHQQREAVAA